MKGTISVCMKTQVWLTYNDNLEVKRLVIQMLSTNFGMLFTLFDTPIDSG